MTNTRSLPRIRLLFAILLWIVALIPLSLVLMGLNDSAQAIAWSTTLQSGSQYLGAIIVGTAVVALVLYPPALPSLRLAIHRSKTRMSIDQGPAAQALERIEHLPTGRDHLIVGTWAKDTGDLQRAATHLIEAIKLEPNSIPAHFAFAEVARKAGNLEVAFQEYAGVVQREPDHAYGRALLGLADTLKDLGQNEEALKAYAQHEKTHGEHRAAFVARAGILQQLGQREAATELLQRAAAAPSSGKLPPEEAYWRAKAQMSLKLGDKR